MLLDLASVRLFILAVEFGNLTRAAEAAGTVQPVVSARIKGLEAALGRKLLERTPRFARPTADGAAFLVRARALMAAHDEAASCGREPAMRFVLGASDHALGGGLEQVVRQVRAALPPSSAIELHLGMSQSLRAAFNAGEFDAVVVRREIGGSGGEVIGIDPLGWRSGGDFAARDGSVPLATLGPPCAIRALAIERLDAARRPWHDAFVGGSIAALIAAVRAGLGVTPLGRIASGSLADVGPRCSLPALPSSEIVMFVRTGSPAACLAARALDMAVRSLLKTPAPD